MRCSSAAARAAPLSRARPSWPPLRGPGPRAGPSEGWERPARARSRFRATPGALKPARSSAVLYDRPMERGHDEAAEAAPGSWWSDRALPRIDARPFRACSRHRRPGSRFPGLVAAENAARAGGPRREQPQGVDRRAKGVDHGLVARLRGAEFTLRRVRAKRHDRSWPSSSGLSPSTRPPSGTRFPGAGRSPPTVDTSVLPAIVRSLPGQSPVLAASALRQPRTAVMFLRGRRRRSPLELGRSSRRPRPTPRPSRHPGVNRCGSHRGPWDHRPPLPVERGGVDWSIPQGGQLVIQLEQGHAPSAISSEAMQCHQATLGRRHARAAHDRSRRKR